MSAAGKQSRSKSDPRFRWCTKPVSTRSFWETSSESTTFATKFSVSDCGFTSQPEPLTNRFYIQSLPSVDSRSWEEMVLLPTLRRTSKSTLMVPLNDLDLRPIFIISTASTRVRLPVLETCISITNYRRHTSHRINPCSR